MKIIITDTNVFFDIIDIGALPEFFALDYEITTTDFVVREILQSEQKEQIENFIRSRTLHVIHLTAEDIGTVDRFKTVRVFKGITDKTVLWKAASLKCPLLTGDKKLRNEAIDLKIEVHGSIWVIQTLIEKNVITIEVGIGFLQKLKQVNDSLPMEEIDKMIKKYKNK